MKILDVIQGSEEWLLARLGIPTASEFDRILTPAKLQPCAKAETYRNQLLAEWFVGHPIDFDGTVGFMERGKELEPQARAAYEFHRDVEVRTVGFLKRDDEMAGASPDGLVGAEGGLELKCPAIQTHLGYMLNPQDLVDAYRSQVQGNLYISGREWWDIMSYHPELPPVIQRVEPDPKYQAALDTVLNAFIANLLECRRVLAPYYEDREAAVAAVRRELEAQAA